MTELRLIYWKVDGAESPEDDLTNYPIFQSYDDIDPGTDNGCGSAAINCLTQSSHGRKFAHETGPMLYNPTNPTGGAVGVATTTARVVAGVFTFGLSEAVITPVLKSVFSASKPILKGISAYSITPGNTMSFLRETVVDKKEPVLILFDRGPNKFHWVCCGGVLVRPGKEMVYVVNDWGNTRFISHSTIDAWTSATLDNFVAVKSPNWLICYSDDMEGSNKIKFGSRTLKIVIE